MDDLLSIYIEDHLALSRAGTRLARRCLSENQGAPLARFLERLVPELEDDRETLRDVARAVGAAPSAIKEVAAVFGEWFGRFKPNGRLLAYSELSRVWELEALMAGTESRRGMWSLLARIARKDPRLRGFDFGRLEERARRHRAELERQRLRAGEAAFRRAPARGAAPAAALAR